MDPLPIPDLFARRSIRRYTEEPISDEQVTTLLQAAMAAPSAGNHRPWHFIVVTNPSARMALAELHPYGKMIAHAPVCIVPCGELALAHPSNPEYWVQDLSAATENLLLAAVGLGLGAVWCGVHPMPEREAGVREILGIPEEITPFALIAVGHPAEEKEPRTQYDVGRVRHERWG